MFYEWYEGERVKDLIGTRVSEPVESIDDAFVPETAEGRHEALLAEPFVPVYARRHVPAEVKSPRATNGWTK